MAALTKCKACGNLISKKAKSCPQCGNPVKKLRAIQALFILFLAIFIFSVFFADSDSPISGQSTNSTITPQRTEPVQQKPNVLYTCRSFPLGTVIENKYIRTAPQMSAPMDNTGDLSPNEQIYVLEDNGEWLRFRVTLKDQGWSAWVPKKFTISTEKLNAEREAKFGKCPTVSSWDGSVRVVKEYLRTIAKDPDSLKYEQWSDVFYNEDDGWIVLCVFRGKNSFGGYDKAANWFVVHHGQVVAVKEADAYSFN